MVDLSLTRFVLVLVLGAACGKDNLPAPAPVDAAPATRPPTPLPPQCPFPGCPDAAAPAELVPR